MEKLLSNFCTLESQSDPRFFQDDKDVEKKRKNTKIQQYEGQGKKPFDKCFI